MYVIDDLVIGTLGSMAAALIDRVDQEAAKEQRAALEALKERAERLRRPDGQIRELLGQAGRDHGETDSPAARVAREISVDPALCIELMHWLLEPDPEAFVGRRASLVENVAAKAGAAGAEVDGFLGRLDERVSQYLGLSQLRSDKKLNLVLGRLSEVAGLRGIICRHHVHLASLMQRMLDRDKLSALVPVCPRPRRPSKTNGLLSGSRPTDEDMDEDIDFRRTRFDEVWTEIASIDTFPTALLFVADPHQGKTTFLKRVGWELAKEGYPVLQLAPGSVGEAYGKWMVEQAAEISDRPLVVLIDDPAQNPQHFEAQMLELHERHPRVIVLIASRRGDWKEVGVDRVPMLRKARRFELNPDITEADRAVARLIEQGIITIEPGDRDAVMEEVSKIPVTEEYLASVIRIASKDAYKPMPVLIAEQMGKKRSSEEARAFGRLYALVCVPGVVGLGLPEDVASALLSEEERYQARRFCDSMAKEPIRRECGGLWATHETHAAAFFKGRDLSSELDKLLEAFVKRPIMGDFLGPVVAILRQRGFGEVALRAWDSVAECISDGHWHACDPELLTASWGAFFHWSGRGADSLHVAEIAVQRAADSFVAHYNYAVALESTGEPLAARKHYEKALVLDPKSAVAHYNFANLLFAEGEMVESRAHYEAALEIDPEKANAHNNYANVLEAQGESAAAQEHFETALRICPEDAMVHYNYAGLLKELGERAEARAHYEEALDLDPGYSDAHYNYANLLAVEAEATTAREHFAKALEINPKCAEAAANCARMYLLEGNFAMAVDLAVRAVRLGTLPERGVRIPRWFAEHAAELEAVVEAADASAERRGGALALLSIVDVEAGASLGGKWLEEPSFAEAAGVCRETLRVWGATGGADDVDGGGDGPRASG